MPRIPPPKDQLLGEVKRDFPMGRWTREVCPGPRKSPKGQRKGPNRGKGGHLCSSPSCVTKELCGLRHVAALSELYFLI